MLVQVKHELGVRTEFTVLMLTMALMACRILPVIITTPMFGGETTPVEVKLGLGLMIGLVMFPAVSDRLPMMKTAATMPLLFIALLLKEVFIGLCIAFVTGIVFDASQVAGQFIDNMSGTNMAQIQVPSIQQSVSLFSSLKLQLVITLFMTLNGHHLVINAFADSLQSIPLDSMPRFHAGFWPLFDLLIRCFGDLFRISLALSAPVLLATFLTDLALGMINRVAPQVQVFFVSMQIKPAVTILVVFSSLHVILQRVTDEYGVMFRWLKQVVYLFS